MIENPLLHRNLKAMTIIGMWPPPNLKHKLLYNIFSKFIYLWFILFTLSQYVEMLYIYNDFKEITANAGVSLLYTVAIAKIYIIFSDKLKFSQLIETIQKTEQQIQNGYNITRKRILQDYILQNWNVSKKFWSLTFWTILGFFVSPTMESLLIGPRELLFANGTSTGRFKKPLVFSSWFPFDKYSDKYYLIAYGLQTISGTFGASYLAIWDTFIVGLMIFPIGQFRILQNSLLNIYDPLSKNKIKVSQNLVKCLTHHNLIIKYIKDLDHLISPVMFLDFLVCSLMLCAIGLQVILEGATVRLGFTIEYLIAMLIQLFMFYWHANEIMLESLKVSKAAWECCWWSCSPPVKKGIVMIMMRAQKPCTLTAGHFYTMSLQTFLLILRASYSYMALLRQMYSREN